MFRILEKNQIIFGDVSKSKRFSAGFNYSAFFIDDLNILNYRALNVVYLSIINRLLQIINLHSFVK